MRPLLATLKDETERPHPSDASASTDPIPTVSAPAIMHTLHRQKLITEVSLIDPSCGRGKPEAARGVLRTALNG